MVVNAFGAAFAANGEGGQSHCFAENETIGKFLSGLSKSQVTAVSLEYL